MDLRTHRETDSHRYINTQTNICTHTDRQIYIYIYIYREREREREGERMWNITPLYTQYVNIDKTVK